MAKEIENAFNAGNYAVYKLEMGYYRFMYEENAIIEIAYFEEKPDNLGTTTSLTDMAAGQLSEYFRGKRADFKFAYKLYGTEFQKKVWCELSKIPYGETRTYKDIAVAIENPKACRAVGMANNRNPIMIVIPCHRVVGSNGKLVGYGAGLKLKDDLLLLEKKYRIQLCDLVTVN